MTGLYVISVLQLLVCGVLVYFYWKLLKILPPDTMVWVHKQPLDPSLIEVQGHQVTAPVTYPAHLMDESETGVEHEVIIRSGKLPHRVQHEGAEYIRTRLDPEGRHIYRRCGSVA